MTNKPSRSIDEQIALLKSRGMLFSDENDKFQEKRPFHVISTMSYLCNAVNPDNIFKQKLFDLFAKYPQMPIYKLGFNNQWQQENIWK